MIMVDPAGVEVGIFCEKLVSTMAADALAPWVTRSSAVMVLTMWDKQALVSYDWRFHHLSVEK